MECLIVDQSDVSEERRELVLRGDEAHHAGKVLRLRRGERFLATNLLGTCYECEFIQARQESKHEYSAIGSILKVLPDFSEPKNDVMLIQGMISQPSRWEFLLEKATEIGVRVIIPTSTARTERNDFKSERSERILRAAVKQTKRANKPWLLTRTMPTSGNLPTAGNPPIENPKGDRSSSELSSLREALSEALREHRKIYMLHEAAPTENTLLAALAASPSNRLAVVVGSEGGFDDDEVAMALNEFGATIVSVSTRRLRAETAAIVALAQAVRDV